MLRVLNEFQPDVLHVSGHGATEGVVFTNDDRTALTVSKEAIVAALRSTGNRVRLALLNNCFSADAAEFIADELSTTAIGMSDAVDDDAAAIFSSSMYRALSYGYSIRSAFDQGVAATMLYGHAAGMIELHAPSPSLLDASLVSDGPTQGTLQASEVARITQEKGDLWELRLYVAALSEAWQRILDKRLNHELLVAGTTGRRIDSIEELPALVSEQIARGTAVVEKLEKWGEFSTRAVGLAGDGVEADADRIVHAAQALVGMYAALLDHVAAIRSITGPSEAEVPLSLLSKVYDSALAEIEGFITGFALQVADLQSAIAADPTGTFEFNARLVLNIDDALMAQLIEAVRSACGADSS